jgi:hypothetical protein
VKGLISEANEILEIQYKYIIIGVAQGIKTLQIQRE